MKALHLWAVGLCIAAFTNITTAQTSLWLTHDSSWKIQGRELVINVAFITNPTSDESGPLFLSVYAQPREAYDGGAPGQLLGRAAIASIPGNGRIDNVLVQAKLRASHPGLKFTALMLERQNGRKFEIIDWVAFTSLYSFPRKQNGGVGSQDSAIGVGDISVSGGALSVAGHRASFSIVKIQNQRELTITGALRLAFYADTQPSGGTPGGQLIGARVLGELAPGDFYRDIEASLLLKRPRPRVEYYVSLFLEEETESGFVPVALVAEVGPQKL
jgi:hypothetical protein